MEATARTAVLSLDGDTPVKLFIADGSRIAFGGYELELPEPSFTGNITAVDYDKRTFVISPAVENPDALVGRYLRITNDGGNDTAFGIAAIRTVPGGTEITVDADPRIARGYTAGAMDNCVDGAISLPLGIWRYYQGKTIVNHDGSAAYRTSGAYQHGKKHVSTEDWISFEAGELHKDLFKPAGLWIDTERHGSIPAERLKREFVAPDGDSPWIYTVYDFGIGDTVHIGHVVTAVRGEGGWRITGTSRGTLITPETGARPFSSGDVRISR